MWKFRPSAFLQDLLYTTSSLSVKALLAFYQQDNERGQKEGVVVPKRQSKQLRTCQWNVHHFYPYNCEDCYTSPNQLATAIAQELIETEADIIVLNEFGESGVLTALGQQQQQPANHVAQCLEDEGYTIHCCADATFPTAIATKLPIKQEVTFALDQERAAVALQVKGLTTTTTATRKGQSTPLWIFATHLEASDDNSGRYRRAEMKRLLQELETRTKNNNDNVLVIGDFNQQREQDYTPKEWEIICANKRVRGSPQDDGVAVQLQEAGFSCIWDADAKKKNCNWDQSKQHPAPPSTHWSGTVIDYTYYRGSVAPSGVFVSPSDLSDHRLVVCDWKNIEVHGGQTYQ